MEQKTSGLKKTLEGGALIGLSLLFLFMMVRRQGGSFIRQAPVSMGVNQKSVAVAHAVRPHTMTNRTAGSHDDSASILALAENKEGKEERVIPEVNSINLKRFGLHQYLVNFAGLASYHGTPCANASILVRISTVNGSQAVGMITKPDGTYATQVLVESMPNQPIDWIVEGYTPEFKKVEIVGRRIGTDDNEPIGVEQEVAFLSHQTPAN